MNPIGGIMYLPNDFARREGEHNRETGCGKTARPDLCGGRWVTGIPTVRACFTECTKSIAQEKY